MASDPIERGFLRLPAGRVHYRYMDGPRETDRLPLYMAHAGPGCSRGLEPLVAALGSDRRVIAPDMLGNGDSDAPAVPQTDMAYYADGVIQVLDRLEIGRVDFYGDHTGAQIGVELAIGYPDRVRRLVLDGVPLFPADLKADLLQNYAPAISPDEYGGYLASIWGFVRDLTLHFPYYRTDPAHRLNFSPIIPLDLRHKLVVDILKALPSYHMAYRAAFSHDTAGRLPLVTSPTLLMAADADPLGVYLEEAAALTPGSRHVRVPREGKGAAIRGFLDQ
jgi:pimeloyl-ACP methyl ester carboxylesterase